MARRRKTTPNPTGTPLSSPEHDGLVHYRPVSKGKRERLLLTGADAQHVAAAPTTAERQRAARQRAMTGPVPRAHAVVLDAATGAPRRARDPGAVPTGRYVASIEGQDVEVDSEDIIGPVRRSGAGGLRFDFGAPAGYLAQARKKNANAPKPKRPRKPKRKTQQTCPPRAPGLRSTFRSSAEAANVFYDGNALFFEHVRDPYDGLRDVFDGIEVRAGKRHKKLGATKKGQAILEASPAEAIRKTLQVIFGRTRSRRWDEVDWPLLEHLGESLQPYFEPYDPSEPSQSGLYWRPFLGDLDAQALAELDPDTLAQVADCESRRELAAALENLRETYAAKRSCIDAKMRRVIEQRLREWSAWQEDPSSAPPSACAPDHHTGGMTCDYPSLFGELRQLQAACEVGYDPDWAEPLAREGSPGFPDLTRPERNPGRPPAQNPDEPPPEVAAAAADDSDSDAPLRVVYSYEAGILVCGDTYPHRAAIKGLRTKRFKFSRRLPDDCAWYVPRTRDRHVGRWDIDNIAEELREASGVTVDVDYTASDPNKITPMQEREAASAERSEERADRLEARSDKKKAESASAYAAAKQVASFIPFGQPVLVGHHSEKRHRRDLEKIERGQRKSFEAEVESERLSKRAEASRRAAQHRKDPNFAQRRIEEIKTELRGLEVTLTGEAPPDWRGLIPQGPATGEYKAKLEVLRAEARDQLGYWQQLVEESGVKVWGPDDFQAGDVLAYKNGFDVVVRVNRKTLSVDTPPHMWDLKKPYTNIKRPPVREGKAWREAIESYLQWLENRSPQPRVFPGRIKKVRAWLKDAGSSSPAVEKAAELPRRAGWGPGDFEAGDVIADDAGHLAVVVGTKPRVLLLESANKDSGQLRAYRLKHALIQDKLDRGSRAWRDALQQHLKVLPDTPPYAERIHALRGWLGLPKPPPMTDPEALAKQLREGEVAALVRAYRGEPVRGEILKHALGQHGLIDREHHRISPLGRSVTEALLRQRPGLTETAGPANTRPPEPEGSMHSLTVRLDSDNIERKDIAAALRKLLRHRHPEVAFTVRTPNYSMASDIDIRPKEDRRWNEAEAAVLRAVLGPNLTIIGNEASFDPRKRVHKGGVEVGPSYLEDFRLFLAGKKPTRKPAKKTRAKPKPPKPHSTTATKSPKAKSDMKQLSIWETPMPTKNTKNPCRPKTKTKAKAKAKTSTKRARPRAPQQNPSKTFHLVAATQALEKAERMLALAQKSPISSAAQLSAAMQAHSEAVLAHQNAAYVLDDGPATLNVRKDMGEIRRKAASISRRAQVIVGAERRPPRRKTPKTNPARPPKPAHSPATDRTLRALRRL